MKVNTSIALKAGLIGAAAALVFGILVNVIPFLVCLFGWVGAVIALATGALYVYFRPGKVEIAEGALGGALAGVIAAVVGALVSNLFAIIFRDATFGSLISGVLIGAVSGAITGAIGGVIWSFIKK